MIIPKGRKTKGYKLTGQQVVVKVIIEVVGIGGWLENGRVMIISSIIVVEVEDEVQIG